MGLVSLVHSPGKQDPDRSVQSMSPLLQRTFVQWSWSWIGLACLFVFLALAVALTAVIEGRWFRNDALLECSVFGKDYFVLAALLREGCVVVVLMVMLVLSLQRRVPRWCALMLSHIHRDIVDLGLFLGHGVGYGG